MPGVFIALFGASTTNLIISDNIISNITCYSSASNISYGISAYSNNASSNCIIKNNIIHDFFFYRRLNFDYEMYRNTKAEIHLFIIILFIILQQLGQIFMEFYQEQLYLFKYMIMKFQIYC